MFICHILMCAHCYLDHSRITFHMHVVETNVGSAFRGNLGLAEAFSSAVILGYLHQKKLRTRKVNMRGGGGLQNIKIPQESQNQSPGTTSTEG